MTPSKIRKEHDLKCRGVNPVQGPDRCWVSFQKCNSPLLLARVSQTSLVFKPDSYFDFRPGGRLLLARSTHHHSFYFSQNNSQKGGGEASLSACPSLLPEENEVSATLLAISLFCFRANIGGRGTRSKPRRGSRTARSPPPPAAGRRRRWLGVGYR
jgi:hypothetical protein